MRRPRKHCRRRALAVAAVLTFSLVVPFALGGSVGLAAPFNGDRDGAGSGTTPVPARLGPRWR